MRLFSLLLAGSVVMLLVLASLMVGASQITLSQIFTDPEARDIFMISRVPRTLALLLTGCAMSVAGLIMQLLTQNKFVEPTTAGTTQSAGFGILMVYLLVPGAPIAVKMVIASLSALAGTLIFLSLLRRISLKSAIVVPLIGIMLGAVISSVTTFIAIHFDLLQSMIGWQSGDFSVVIQGRYELLWLVALLTLLAAWTADRFTVAGMGREFSINVGLNYRRVVLLGLSIIAIISGIVVVVVGSLPFLGLVVPNLVSMVMGDNVRRSIPWICLIGGGIVLLCDIIGRLLAYPFEIPAGTVLGVIGAVVFLILLLRTRAHAR